MALNNTLVEYGIQNEETDLRAHVCVVAKVVYVYPTINGVRAIETGVYRTAPAFQDGRQTAMGYLVPPADIADCIACTLPQRLLDTHPITEAMNTTEKGEAAARMVSMGIRRGVIALPYTANLVTDLKLQLAGVDLIVRNNLRIQVKCDYRGGEKSRGGTGNLYLQFAESNPFKQH